MFGVSGFGRLAWAQTVKIRQLDFVVAARSGGASTWRIVTTHIVPNVSGPLLTYALFTVGHAMLIEAGLSYLGLGVPDPPAELGQPHLVGPELRRPGPAAADHARGRPVRDDRILNLLADGLGRRLALDRG